MVRAGEISARELTEASLSAIESLDPKLGAFVCVDAERALAQADKIKPGDERPFAGVPTAIKDIGPFLAGYPYTAGSRLFGDFTPEIDSSIVRRVKDAGFVIVGKTKTPEMGIVPVTEPERYGPARNPYDTERTPGGSSGGAAAAVAGGMLPIAHGNDGGGSLRIPGACCGLIGLKPSRNRVSSAPLLGDSVLNCDLMLARTTADVAAALDVMAGYEPGDANWAPPPSRPFTDAAKTDPGRLKIGFTTSPPVDVQIDPSHVQQVDDVAKLLERLGHDVQPVTVPWDNPEMMVMFTKIFAGWISSLTEFAGAVGGSGVSEDAVERLTWEMLQMARDINALEWIRINTAAQGFSRAVVASMLAYDAILTPVLNMRPVPIGWIDTSEGMAAFGRSAEFVSFTAGVNLSGQPAVSIPTGLGDDGLPHAVQLIGRPAGEDGLLSLVAQLEAELRWSELRPQTLTA